jgi:alkylated DNA nucleotide flippase Atl1
MAGLARAARSLPPGLVTAYGTVATAAGAARLEPAS